ncbi:MAG TPA: DUF4143 domain-containing protein [Methanocorpusculum sp.]|nr:DUF4143 domain-containing protein [Methanocorpusculum sp.]
MNRYIPRIVDSILKEKLAGKGAVLIEGPKWCGKTTTAMHLAKSAVFMADPQKRSFNMSQAEFDPAGLLAGDTPRLIDEWQIVPQLWDSVRFEVDRRNEFSQFILTGSAVPPDLDKIFHSGIGRISRMVMRPMTLYESGESNGTVSLASLFAGQESIFAENPLTYSDLKYVICRGGWPQATLLTGKLALDQAFDYCDGVIRSDIPRADRVSHNSERLRRLMRSYARNQGSQASYPTLCKDLQTNEAESITPVTLSSYVNTLKKIFVIEDMPAWNPNLRSKTAIRTADTHYFVDPSIATASLELGPDDLDSDLTTTGLLFESLCIRDLRVYTEALSGRVYHYRDKSNLECDAVLHLRNGTYGLVEIKLGGDTLIEEGAASLKKLRDTIDTEKMKKPAFLMVLIGAGPGAYRRDDGVYVVPIGCLKP